jgi:hypothetical protein
MKKIYLLSAVACMFAFNANAELIEGWEAKGPDVKQSSPTVVLEKGDTGFTWDSQFNPPTWLQVGAAGTEFEIHFDAKYDGEGTDGDMEGLITFIQGRQFGGYPGDDAVIQALCESLGVEVVPSGDKWKIQNMVEQLIVDKANQYGDAMEIQPGNLCRNVQFKIYDEFDHYAMHGTLGRHAADSVDLEFEFGTMAGTFELKNFQFFVGGQVFAQYFMQPGEGAEAGKLFAGGSVTPPTAIADAAAVKAFFANDVLYASEAADVVVYNVNGVAVKSAKNVKSVNVADLKAGLYIAKVGNATVKFVK